MAQNPLTYGEIEAWARLMNKRPQPWETHALKQLDALFMDACAAAQKAKAEKK